MKAFRPVRCRWQTAIAAALLWAIAAPAADEENQDEGEAEGLPAIRVFDVETLSELGREIYRHDQLAWKATDALFEEVTPQQLASDGTAGWLVDMSGRVPLVRFLREGEDGPEAAYDVLFPANGDPILQIPDQRDLSAEQRLLHQATRAAIDALIERNAPWCGGNANTVTLADPEEKGFLVYVLRPKGSMDEVPVGGHYRVSISADGKKAKAIDQLFASCLTLSRNEGAPEKGSLAALSVTHTISDTPLETHVFLSLQEGLPFYVSTPSEELWRVEDGDMELIGP